MRSTTLPHAQVILLIFVCLFGASAAATTFTVTKTADTSDGSCDGDCSLREALIAADAAAFFGGDHVVEIPNGTYRLSRDGAGEDQGQIGDLDLVAARGTLEIRGAGRSATIIDGNNLDRVFDLIATQAVVVISDLTIRGGRTTGAGEDGGGVRNAAALTIRRVDLVGNRVTSSAAVDGGGLFNVGEAMLVDCTVRDNSTANGLGGGLFSESELTVEDSSITGNAADAATGAGGGIASLSDLVVRRSTIDDNSAGGADFAGGGIFSEGALEVINSTVSRNRAASGRGGGIAATLGSGTLTLRHVTLSENEAAQGSALAIDDDTDLVATSTLVDGGCFGPIGTGGGNLESPNATCGFGVDDQVNVSAPALALGPLSDNGGPTRTHVPEAAAPPWTWREPPIARLSTSAVSTGRSTATATATPFATWGPWNAAKKVPIPAVMPA